MRQSAFLQLPGELRSKIYEYTLYEGDYRCEHPNTAPRLVKGSFPNRLSILRVCYQIHGEAALIPFKINTFRISNVSCLTGWKSLLTVPQRRAITSIQFHTFDLWIQTELYTLRNLRPRDNGQLSKYYLPGVRHVRVVARNLFWFSVLTPLGSREGLESLREWLGGRHAEVEVDLVRSVL